jgi:tetratricopeptide (TPR) repeat protein
MCKPQVIAFPVVLLLLDYWPLGRTRFGASAQSDSAVRQQSFARLVGEKIPLLGISAISAVITLEAQRAGHAVRTAVEYSLASRIETAIVSYVWYVRDVFVPWHLAPIYPHADGLLATWKVLLSGTVLIAISAIVVMARKRAPYLLFGWLWFLSTLVPMIGLIQVGEQARADRYMYVSLIGILVAVIWGSAELLGRYKVSPAWSASLFTIVLLAFSVATFRQIGHWRDSETLWNYTMSVTERNFMAEDNLAQEQANQGRTEEALVHFHNVLKLHDWPPSQLIAFAAYEQRQGYAADAIIQYERALRESNDPKTRSLELSNIGSAYMDLKDSEHARQSFDQALQFDPENVPALIGSGLIAQRSGNLTLAIRQYTKAISLKPNDLGYALLSRAFEQSGRISDADIAEAQAEKFSQNIENTRSTVNHLLAE